MSGLDLDNLRRRLLARREKLMATAGTSEEAAATVQLDQSRVGRLSRMDALQGQAMSVEMARRRKLTLERIERALQRMDQGVFGDCEECGESIATARLEHDPAAELCIRCATEAEED